MCVRGWRRRLRDQTVQSSRTVGPHSCLSQAKLSESRFGRFVARSRVIVGEPECRGRRDRASLAPQVGTYFFEPRLLPPGRFDRRVAVQPPDKTRREMILGVNTRGMPLAPDVDLKEIAASTSGLVGAHKAPASRWAPSASLARAGSHDRTQRHLPKGLGGAKRSFLRSENAAIRRFSMFEQSLEATRPLPCGAATGSAVETALGRPRTSVSVGPGPADALAGS
jgi:hypothetical protein